MGSCQMPSDSPGISIQAVSAPKAPIMKISPWAKLISWMMP